MIEKICILWKKFWIWIQICFSGLHFATRSTTIERISTFGRIDDFIHPTYHAIHSPIARLRHTFLRRSKRFDEGQKFYFWNLPGTLPWNFPWNFLWNLSKLFLESSRILPWTFPNTFLDDSKDQLEFFFALLNLPEPFLWSSWTLNNLLKKKFSGKFDRSFDVEKRPTIRCKKRFDRNGKSSDKLALQSGFVPTDDRIRDGRDFRIRAINVENESGPGGIRAFDCNCDFFW